MMQAIRGRAGSIIVKVLFGLLIVSFGFWGIYTRSPFYQSQSPDTVVATVGDQSIRAADVQQALQPTLERLRAQFGSSIDPQQVKQLGILDSVLGQLIDRVLLDQETRRLGLDVSDATVRAAIFSNPAFRSPDGQFDRSRFEQLLVMNHLTEDQLVARVRRDIPRTELLQAIAAGAAAPRPVVDALYRYRNEKRIADIVELPVASVTGVAAPSDAELDKFYHDHQDLFRAPEYRSLTVASLSAKDIEKPGDISEDRLRKEYEQRKDELATSEQRDIQQLLAPSEDKAKQVEAEVKAGKDWTEIAKELGQDADTVDLGLLSSKEIPHELGDVAFQLPLNQPSQPIKSPVGWHILRVSKIEPASTPSFEEAKPKIEAALALQAATDRLDKIANQADDALAGGASLTEVAKKFGLNTAEVTTDESGHAPDGKQIKLPFASEPILKTAFSTDQGGTSRVTDTDDGAIYAVKVDKVTPPAVRPLADVKDKAIQAWQEEQQRETVKAQAEALAAAAKADGSLAKAAGDKKLTLLAAVALSRRPTPGDKVPPALAAKLFAAKEGDIVTIAEPTAAFTAQLKEVQSPKTVPDAAATLLSEQLAREQQGDIVGSYTDALKKRFPVEIERDALNRMF
jgi:peptidyl-prolyl cis-trans isomerase D